ncbi:hypothetical protein PHLCEN_2v12457 [Hermanssonia centrifuga]|uniref:Secreted protein n=1 Tax=Hermanssonia centrifuga TaxID=98765 RepID=A0A2R6NGU3_9APHY|nr:hypothetical protein PHLCEN_2v12457 [Hermanssonia centrifuga]
MTRVTWICLTVSLPSSRLATSAAVKCCLGGVGFFDIVGGSSARTVSSASRLHHMNQWEVCKILQVIKWVMDPYLHWGDAQAEIE